MNAHPHQHGQGDRQLVMAVAANVLLTVAEIAGGVLSGSLSLIADAVHNLSDAGSLLVALLARKISRKPADSTRTFGYGRAEVVGSLINVTTLVVVGLYLIFEAVSRYFQPEPIAGWVMVWVSGIALIVDVVTALLTYSLAKESLNIRAAFVHNVADALGSVGVIVAGTLIIVYDFYIADLIATLIIAGYVLFQGIKMMRQAIRALMDSVPEDLDIERVALALGEVEGVENVHHLHIWLLGEDYPALEAHVVLVENSDMSQMEKIRRELKSILCERFRIEHSTLEFERRNRRGDCEDDKVVVEHK